jgi:hypothetical protein
MEVGVDQELKSLERGNLYLFTLGKEIHMLIRAILL